MKYILIKNAKIVNEEQIKVSDILIAGQRIHKIQESITPPFNCQIIDASGLFLIPGLIDSHVHFREPGFTPKGSIATESMAAVAGGITSFMDMPNTLPNATNIELLEEKYVIAAKDSYANYSFYFGVNSKNLHDALKINNEDICGITDDGLYFSDNQGMLSNRPDYLRALFSNSQSLIALHCEDEDVIEQNEKKYKKIYGQEIPPQLHAKIRSAEACLKATNRVLDLAKEYDARVHILHLSTGIEAGLFNNSKKVFEKKITCEVCVHHLLFNEADYITKGMQIKWNPSIKKETDRLGLIAALMGAQIDCISTDHAPHLLSDKSGNYFKSMSGAPSIQHALPALMSLMQYNTITLDLIVRKYCHNPAEVFRLVDRGYIREGYYADLVLIDLEGFRSMDDQSIFYKSGWSPFQGDDLPAVVTKTFVNGKIVYDNGKITGDKDSLRLKFKKERLI